MRDVRAFLDTEPAALEQAWRIIASAYRDERGAAHVVSREKLREERQRITVQQVSR